MSLHEVEMEYIKIFKGDCVSNIQKNLDFNGTTTTATLCKNNHCNTVTDSKLQISDVISSTSTSSNESLLSIVTKVIAWMNESDLNNSYQLRGGDIKDTRCKNNGILFKNKNVTSCSFDHSYSYNLINDFNLILRLSYPGIIETFSHKNKTFYPCAQNKADGFDIDTITSGNGLLHEKDLKKKIGIILSEENVLITAELWTKPRHVSEQVLFVYFPIPGHPHPSETVSNNKNGYGYVFPISYLRGSMLGAYVRFMNKGYESTRIQTPIVLTYECTNFTLEEFSTVAKILLHSSCSCIDEEQICNDAACIDFFGPFPKTKILSNLSLQQQKYAKETERNSLVKFKTDSKEMPEMIDIGMDMDFIVCENERRTKVVLDTACVLGLDDYIPFKMIFIEGITYDYNNRIQYIPMTNVALLLGEYNHVFGIQSLQNIDPSQSKLKQLHQLRTFDLKFALGNEKVNQNLTEYIFFYQYDDSKNIFFPSSSFLEENVDQVEDSYGDQRCNCNTLFHRDMNGNTVFTDEEAATASKYIASMGFCEHVKASLQKKQFQLSQEIIEYEKKHEDESMYVNMKVLFVTGVVRLNKSVTIRENSVSTFYFDAWPTRNDQREMVEKILNFFNYRGIDIPRGLIEHLTLTGLRGLMLEFLYKPRYRHLKFEVIST